MLTVDDWITSSGKYKQRASSEELTDAVKEDAQKLIEKVNAFLLDLGVEVSTVKVSSGFRPSSVNATIKNAAKKSLHMSGRAIDLVDSENAIGKLIQEKPELLTKHGLWLEHPSKTPGWCHLDIGTRSSRKVQIFYP